MKEICIPIPHFQEDQIAEVTLKVDGKEFSYDFRVESFPWDISSEEIDPNDPLSKSLLRIYKLKKAIESYNKEWELVQIYTPSEDANFIQVLYRKKK